MALIQCPECNHQVSKNAPVCPQCGCPIAENKKDLKAHAQLSTIMIIVGVVWLMIPTDPGAKSLIPMLLTMGGFGWFVLTRLRS